MGRRRLHPSEDVLLCLILLGYLASALRTSLTVPLYRGPDESQHLQYVHALIDGQGLPVMRLPPETNLASQESAQPPVYYSLVAALTFWTDRVRVTTWVARGLEGILDAVNRLGWVAPLNGAFFDSPRAWWPRTSIVLGYAARLPALAFGLVALIVLFRVLRTLTADAWSALAATAWLGWNSNFTYIHAFVTPDSLLALLSAVALGLMLTALQRGLSGREPLGLGLILSLLVLTKLNGLALLPAASLAIALMPRPWPDRLRTAAIVGLVVGLFAAWWFIRNWTLYGEPTGLRMMAAIEGVKGGVDPQTLTPARIAELLRRGYQTFASPWANWFDVFFGLGFIGALLGLSMTRWRRLGMFLVAMVALSIAPFVIWANAFVYGWHARLFLPVWPALAALWAIGFTTIVPRRARPLAVLLLLAILGYFQVNRVLAVQPPHTRNAYFYLPAISERDRLELDDGPIARFGESLVLRQLDMEWAQVSPELGERRPLHIALTWETVGGIPDPNSAFFVHIITPAGERVAQVDTFQELDTPPLLAWPIDHRVLHLNRLLIPTDQVDQSLTLYFGVYNKRTGERWPVWLEGEPWPLDHLEAPVPPAGD